ncbi:MAG: hypothetical protein FWG43_04765 [Clostridiales bacterium]|nr:hypothetical protein [Clostridiales bacterium]
MLIKLKRHLWSSITVLLLSLITILALFTTVLAAPAHTFTLAPELACGCTCEDCIEAQICDDSTCCYGCACNCHETITDSLLDTFTDPLGNDLSIDFAEDAPETLNATIQALINDVSLITAEVIEIGYDEPIFNNAEAHTTFSVQVDGEEVEWEFLSYFDNNVVDKPVVNIRLAEPLKIREAPYTAYTLGSTAAASLSVALKAGGEKVGATWKPYYTFYDQLASNGTSGQRSNRGSRGLMWVWGNENSRCAASTFADETFNHIPTSNRTNYQTATWVVGTYVAAAIDRTVGRSEQLVNAANVSGMHVVIVGNGDSVYSVPEYRQLYVSGVTEDWSSRVTIGGSRKIPIVVTTAEDACRVKSANDNTFEMMREFARLFLELGVKDGWSNFALGIYDDPDAYNCYKRLVENYRKSRAAGLWPGTNMLNSLEDYYVLGTMIYFECLPESSTWQAESFPINTRRELLDYDLGLYEVMVEVYGEWEYFVGGGTSNSDSSRRWGAPWYKHSQVENYTVVNGRIQPYEPLRVIETNLISPSQVELVFNREIKDLDELRTLANWELTWIPSETCVITIGATTYTFNPGTTYTFNSTSTPRLVMEYYMWKTLTLKVTGMKFNSGFMSYEIGGFTEDEIEKAFDSSLSVAEGYKPWFTEDAYYRDLNPIGKGFMGDIGDPSGWMADTASTVNARSFYAVSQKVYDSQTAEEIAAKKLVVGKKIPQSDYVRDNLFALEKGEYVRFDGAKGGFITYDKKNQPQNNGEPRFPATVNGSLNVTFKASPAVTDWADNPLAAQAYSVSMNPWQTQVMRSEKTGVYVYADAETQKNSLLVGCDYWDYMYSNPIDNIGQRLADGFNFAYYHKNVKTGEYASGGLDILGYHNHMYMAPNRRSLYNAGPTVLYAEGLGYHVCSTMEYSLLRDYQYTRYDHESIMHHEGAHSVEYPAMFYYTDLNFEAHEIWDNFGYYTWSGNRTYSTYASSNMAEWFATLSTYWFGTMRESVDGTITGVWTPISTREELYEFDRKGYEFMKKVYYNGETYLDPAKVPAGQTALKGWDEQGNSINDDFIKWGLTFPETMNEDRADWGITNQFRWASWGAPNVWDIKMSTVPGNGLRYVQGEANPEYAGREIYGENYNPFLLMPTLISITSQPKTSTTVTQGRISGSLFIEASSSPSKTIAYQWYKNTSANNNGGSLIPGANKASFNIPTNLMTGTYYYYCVASIIGLALPAHSDIATVIVNPPKGGGSGGSDPVIKDTVSKDETEPEAEVEPEEPTGSKYSPLSPLDPAGTVVTAGKTNNKILLDEKEIDIPAVKIHGYNWLKLRDLAMVLNSTNKKFSVTYDETTRIVDIRTNQSYTPLGDELSDKLAETFDALATTQKIRIDGVFIDAAAYNISGYNYLRLRDLAILLDFLVEYDEETAEVTINPSEPYNE